MAQIDVKTTVTAPEEIDIPLVRADYASVSNASRMLFEFFLAIFSGLVGHTASVDSRSVIHWVALAICGAAGLAFMLFSIQYGRKAREV